MRKCVYKSVLAPSAFTWTYKRSYERREFKQTKHLINALLGNWNENIFGRTCLHIYQNISIQYWFICEIGLYLVQHILRKVFTNNWRIVVFFFLNSVIRFYFMRSFSNRKYCLLTWNSGKNVYLNIKLTRKLYER